MRRKIDTVLSGIASIGLAVIEIMAKHNLSKAFGHGVGFTIGLYFFDPVFRMILGFGSSQYTGNPITQTM